METMNVITIPITVAIIRFIIVFMIRVIMSKIKSLITQLVSEENQTCTENNEETDPNIRAPPNRGFHTSS